MSIIEDALAKFIDERIAAYMQGGQAQPAQLQPQAVAPQVPATGPTTVPPVAMPQIPAAGPPVAVPPVATPPGPPTAVPPGPPQASPPGPPVATPPQATAPMAPPAPVQGGPSLDDLRALANDLMRTHPEKATEFQAFMASKGVTSLADMDPQFYVETQATFKSLMGVA